MHIQKKNANLLIIQRLAFYIVHDSLEILNLYIDFLKVVDFLQCSPNVMRILRLIDN